MTWTLLIILNFGYPDQIVIERADLKDQQACFERGIHEMRNRVQPTAFRCVPGYRV